MQEALDNEWARQQEAESKGLFIQKEKVSAQEWEELKEKARQNPDYYIEYYDDNHELSAIEVIPEVCDEDDDS